MWPFGTVTTLLERVPLANLLNDPSLLVSVRDLLDSSCLVGKLGVVDVLIFMR